MKQNLIPAILCLVALCCASPVCAATCAPPKLVHIVTADVTPGVQAGSFNAQPRSYYRLGDDKVRIEEAIDSVNGIHQVVVIAEPNIWIANLYDNTGKHIVDPGPEFYAKAPIFFGTPGLSPKFLDLEFGCEADFIAANAAKPVRSEKVGAVLFDVYRVDGSSDAVEILEQTGSGTPSFARYYQKGKLLTAIRYDLYSTGLANDPSLFVPPPNVHFTDAT